MSSNPFDAVSGSSASGPGDGGGAVDAGAGEARGSERASAVQYHDALFRRIFGDPAHAAEVLRAILPPQVAAHFDWNSFEASHASVVSEGFEQRHGDLQFRARLVDGREAFVRLLFEHQSTVDRWMSWRMTDMVHAFLRDARQRRPEARYLPAVLPVVLYQGAQPWTAPTSLLDLTDLSDDARRALGPYLLSLRYVLDELRVVEVGAIDARALSPVPRLTLGIMKHYQSGTVIAFLHDHAEDVRVLYATEHGRLCLALLLQQYTWQVNPHTTQETLVALVSDLVGQNIEQTMVSLEELLNKETYDRGRKDGVEAIVKDQREVLLRLLERRFGALPESATQRVAGASTEDLKRWFGRILDAASLDDLFAPA